MELIGTVKQPVLVKFKHPALFLQAEGRHLLEMFVSLEFQ